MQRYLSGAIIRALDRVRYAGASAVIAFVNDSRDYSPGFIEAEWDYLGPGFMIRHEDGTLIFLPQADEDLELVERA